MDRFLCRLTFLFVCYLLTVVWAQNNTMSGMNMGNMTMTSNTTASNTTTPAANATASNGTAAASNGTTTAATSNATTNGTAASNSTANATVTLQTQCGRIPLIASNQSIQANGIFMNGSCYVSTYMGNVTYKNVTSSCTKVMKMTNSTAGCQMLQVTNTGLINMLISSKLITIADRFFIGLSRLGCNSTWAWDNSNGSRALINATLDQFKDLPGQNKSCGFDNVMFGLSEDNKSQLGGVAPNSTGNALVCECRTEYTLAGSQKQTGSFNIAFSALFLAIISLISQIE
ncbi:hypothetical protein M3Y97_00295400 [Aphelenchoides bicaudatus]|nr:hypothetical protein M3Y97_00295400 [Aphelenchoides bicaudatus]